MKSKILSVKTTYHARAFFVEKVNLRLPNGKTTEYDRLNHSGAVTIVPVDDKGNIYFVRQFRVGADADLLELPAGTLGRNEDPFDCATREVREEVGMAAKEISLLGDFFLAPGYSSEHMYVYLARDLVEDPLPGDEDEFLQVVQLSWEKVKEMIKTNQIKDGKTLAALLLLQESYKTDN